MVQGEVLDRRGDRRPYQHQAHHQAAGELPLPSDPAGVLLEGGLLRGWNVETRDPLPRIPLLYGENGKPLYGVNPDAIYAGDDGYRALLEIEGGGAVQNNRLMKDVVETLLIPGAHHLALAVPHSIHGRSPYDFAMNLIFGPLRA